MNKDIEIKTTLDTILKGYELRQFHAAKQAWKGMINNAISGRQIICQVGTALNNLYAFGKKKGLKKVDLTDLIRKHFDGLNRFERSDFRKYALNAYDYNSFCLAFDIRSITAPYIMNKYKQYRDEAKLNRAKTSVDNKDDVKNVETVKNRTTNKVIMGKNTVKSGIEPTISDRVVTPEEALLHSNYSINAVIRHYNANKYNAEQISDFERLLTNALIHINDPKVMDKVFDLSELTKVA